MISASNPFIAGPSVGHTASFVGREDILRRIELELAQGATNSMVLYGQRRIGKTSVLEALARRLPERGPFPTVFFDLQDKAHESLDRVLSLLAESIADRLELAAPDFSGNASGIFRERWLPAVLAKMPTDSRLVLLFDEFDVLADPKAEQAARALFPYLRDLLCSDLPIFIVFTLGRSIGDLSAYALSLVKGIQSHKISVLEHRDANRLLNLSEENGSLRWSPEARAVALERTHGHPYFLQQIGKELWLALVANRPTNADPGPPMVEVHDVEAVMGDVFAHSQNVLEWLWDGLTPACRLVASAFAEYGPYVKSDDELQQILQKSGVKSIIRELLDAPRLLREWDLIESVGEGYRFRVELLRTWIRLNKPLRMVQDELDRLHPAAENAYNLAVYYEKSGQATRSVALLKEALEQNPNHVAAALLLSDIYISQGTLDEALRQLELLHDNLPSIATPKLVNVLLMRARGAEDPLVAESFYEKALTLSPHGGEAKRGLQQIWLERGRQFERAERLDDALDAFGRAAAQEDHRRVEREIVYRRQAHQLARLRDYEAKQQYAEALVLARHLCEELHDSPPDWRERGRSWGQYIDELAELQNLTGELQRGLEHLNAGQREDATALFLEVVRKKANYPDAARYLYWAIEGRDPKAGPAPPNGRARAFPYLIAFSAFITLALTVSILVLPSRQLPKNDDVAPPHGLDGHIAAREEQSCVPGTNASNAPPIAAGSGYLHGADVTEIWRPEPELQLAVTAALRAPFEASADKTIVLLESTMDKNPEAQRWATEQLGQVTARRIAWYDLTILLAQKVKKKQIRRLRAEAVNRISGSDSSIDEDPVIGALSELTETWEKRLLVLPWLDDKNSRATQADPCLRPSGEVVMNLLRRSRIGAQRSALSAAELCGSNPIVDVLQSMTRPEKARPTHSEALEGAVRAVTMACEKHAAPGNRVELVFAPTVADSPLAVEVTGIYKGTPLGICVEEAARKKLVRMGALQPTEKLNAVIRKISF